MDHPNSRCAGIRSNVPYLREQTMTNKRKNAGNKNLTNLWPSSFPCKFSALHSLRPSGRDSGFKPRNWTTSNILRQESLWVNGRNKCHTWNVADPLHRDPEPQCELVLKLDISKKLEDDAFGAMTVLFSTADRWRRQQQASRPEIWPSALFPGISSS